MKFSHKEASEQIARIYGVEAQKMYYPVLATDGIRAAPIYITQDLGALMELAIMYGIGVVPDNFRVETFGNNIDSSKEYYTDHNNNPIEATLMALYKALIKKGGE